MLPRSYVHLKLRGGGVTMNPRNVSVSETVLARLDVALDLAAAELASSGTAERRLRSLISRLLDDDTRRDPEIAVVRLLETRRNRPAKSVGLSRMVANAGD